MDPNNREHLAIARNRKLSEKAKVGRFIARNHTEVINSDPRNLQYRFDSLVNKLLRFSTINEVKIGCGDEKSPSFMHAGYETPEYKFSNNLSLQFFIFKPNDKNYQPSIIAKYYRKHPKMPAGSQPPIFYKEYLTRDTFEEKSIRHDPNAPAILELLIMSVDAYQKTAGITERED